jgi:hypothetical protein
MMAKPSDPAPTETPTAFSVDLTVSGNKITGTIYPVGTAPPDVEQPPPDIEEPPPDIEQPPPDVEQPPDGDRPVIRVGPGEAFSEPADAIGSVPPGGILELADGRYAKPVRCQNEGILVRSASGNPYRCWLDGGGGEGGGHPLSGHKGMFYASKSFRIEGVGFRNCGSPDSGPDYSNEAAIWIGDIGGAQVKGEIHRCAIDNGAMGVFCAVEPTIDVVITETLYGYLGPNGQNASLTTGTGAAHDNYLQGNSAEISGCYFWGTYGGHNVKSRMPTTDCHDNPCMTQDGGRVFEAPDGGEASFDRNVVYTRTDRAGQPPPSAYGNANMLAYCSESTKNGASMLTMSGNTLHVSRSGSTIWAGSGSIQASGDTVRCYGEGSLKLEGNIHGIQSPPPSGTAPSLPNPPAWAQP